MSRALGIRFGFGLALLLTACDRSYLQGRVTDIHGEALPGVIVRESGGAAEQDLTDGLGHYRIPLTPTSKRVEISKSGYTSAALLVDAAARRGGTMPDAALWPLPQNPGVYVVNDLHFAETTWVVPRQFYLKDGTAPFGVELPKEIREAAGEPFIVAYRTPRYNARLSRLMAAEAQSAAAEEAAAVWVEDIATAAALEPIDTPENQQGQLLRVRVGRPLDPGIYCVHWGALEGYTTLDNRVFLFRVPEPPPAEPGTAPAETAAEPKTEATPAPASMPEKKTEAPAKKTGDKASGKQSSPATPTPPKKEAAPPPELLEPSDAPAVRPPTSP